MSLTTAVQVALGIVILVLVVVDVRQGNAIRDLEDRLSVQEVVRQQPSEPAAPTASSETAAEQPPPTTATPPSISSSDIESLHMVSKLARGVMDTESAQMMGIGKQLETNPDKAIERLRVLVPQMDKAGSVGRMELALLMFDQVEPKRAAQELRQLYDGGGTPRMRAMVAGALAKRGDDSALRDFLSDMATHDLRSTDRTTRMLAAVALGETKNPMSIPYIVGLTRDENVQVRIQATYALGTVKDETALRELYKLQENPSPAVRDAATRTLEQLSMAELNR